MYKMKKQYSNRWSAIMRCWRVIRPWLWIAFVVVWEAAAVILGFHRLLTTGVIGGELLAVLVPYIIWVAATSFPRAERG